MSENSVNSGVERVVLDFDELTLDQPRTDDNQNNDETPRTNDETSSAAIDVEMMHLPPAQDSPEHILNALNDDCILSILRELTNLRDFLRATEVCTRFQENAKRCFRVLFKQVRVDDSYVTPYSITVTDLPSFLPIFGEFMQSLEWLSKENRNQDNINVFEMIAKHSDSLNELMSLGQNLDFNTCSKFKALEAMHITSGAIHNFQSHLKLKYLVLRQVKIKNIDWLTKPFPKLRLAEFFKIDTLTDDVLIKFLAHNPQLRRLKLSVCENLTSASFEYIAKCVPNLRYFTFASYTEHLLQNFNEHVLHLTNLKHLRSLRITTRRFSARPLVEALVEKKTNITDLMIDGADTNLAESIQKLKSLKNLILIAPDMSEEILIDFVQQLPVLERIITSCVALTPLGLIRILGQAQKLSTISISANHVTIDAEAYMRIFPLAKDRIKVFVAAHNGEIDLPTNQVTADHRKWLHIAIKRYFAFHF